MKDWYLIKDYVDDNWIFHVQFKELRREISNQEYSDLIPYLINYAVTHGDYTVYSFKLHTPNYIKHYLIKCFLYENRSIYEYEEMIRTYKSKISTIKELRKILDHEYTN